jgi:hypothetical protein
LLGRHGDARELLEQTLSALDDPNSLEAAGLELELAADRFSLGDWTAMRAHAERGWTIATDAGGEGIRASAHRCSAWPNTASAGSTPDGSAAPRRSRSSMCQARYSAGCVFMRWIGWAGSS